MLLWSVWSFAAKPLPDAVETLPVDLITASEFSKITAGNKDAPQSDKPKPAVDKVAEPKPVEDQAPKVDNKEVKAAREAEPAPPEQKPVEQKAAEPKQAEAKPDPIADMLAKDEAKKPEPKKVEAKTPMPPKKPAPPAPKFDAKQVEALLDKRDATRVAAADNSVNNEPSLGRANGDAPQLSQSEIDAFRRRLEECWTPPLGVNKTTNLQVIIRVLFKVDGTVARPPELVSGPVSMLGPAMAESAKRAVLSCQPFTMLKPEHYEQWKDIEINFDPRFMIRG